MEYKKHLIRRTLLVQRNGLLQREYADVKIFEKITAICEDFSKIFTYISYGSEVNTLHFIETMLKKGKEIYVPVCRTKNCTMAASQITSLKNLTKNSYGILEPDQIINENAMFDAIIFPGAAFDLSGSRIGYGKGYYDRFMSKLDYKPKKIGICYDFQLLKKIPSEAHDVKMDLIITEDRTVSV